MEPVPDISDLVCPATKQPLRNATPDELALIREAHAANTDEPVSGGVVTEDSSRGYPVVDGIPVLVADAAIVLTAPKPDTSK